jgi:hypothetical protein
MMKTISTLCLFVLLCINIKAQNINPEKGSITAANVPVQPFLFSVNTLTSGSPFWSVSYSSGYGQRTAGPFGYDGADQQVAVQGYLGNRFTLYANTALGFARGGGVNSSQQAEIIRDFIGGRQPQGARFGVGLGVNRDFSNVGAVFSRITASFDAASWRMGGNLRFEKAFSKQRDGIDLVTSIGFQRRIAGPFFAGIEAVGEDLEGFWEADEAEGGAKLLVGPSINMVPNNSRFSFSVCGGPVFYATRSTAATSQAIRDVGTLASQNGYTIRAMVSFNFR